MPLEKAPFEKRRAIRGNVEKIDMNQTGPSLLSIRNERGDLITAFADKQKMRPWHEAGMENDMHIAGVLVTDELGRNSITHYTLSMGKMHS